MKAVVRWNRCDVGKMRLTIEFTPAPDNPFSKEAVAYADSMKVIAEALLNHGPHFMIRAMKYLPEEMQDEVQAYLASWPGTMPWLDELWDEYGSE